jgi:hypothetical protein
MKPIFDNRSIIGYASTITGAAKQIRKLIDIDKRAKLHVWIRDTSIIDLPPGFVYSISWSK